MRREGKLKSNHTLRKRNICSCNPLEFVKLDKSNEPVLKEDLHSLHDLNSSKYYYPQSVGLFLPNYSKSDKRAGHIVNKNYVTDRINLNVTRILRENINGMKNYQENHKQGKKHKRFRLLEGQDLCL